MRSESPVLPSTMDSQDTQASPEASTTRRTRRPKGRPTPWSGTIFFTIFPGKWTTRCQWCRCTRNQLAGCSGRVWTLLPATRPSSSTARRSFCREPSPAPGPREDLGDDTNVAEQLLFFFGGCLICPLVDRAGPGETIVMFLFFVRNLLSFTDHNHFLNIS